MRQVVGFLAHAIKESKPEEGTCLQLPRKLLPSSARFLHEYRQAWKGLQFEVYNQEDALLSLLQDAILKVVGEEQAYLLLLNEDVHLVVSCSL